MLAGGGYRVNRKDRSHGSATGGVDVGRSDPIRDDRKRPAGPFRLLDVSPCPVAMATSASQTTATSARSSSGDLSRVFRMPSPINPDGWGRSPAASDLPWSSEAGGGRATEKRRRFSVIGAWLTHSAGTLRLITHRTQQGSPASGQVKDPSDISQAVQAGSCYTELQGCFWVGFGIAGDGEAYLRDRGWSARSARGLTCASLACSRSVAACGSGFSLTYINVDPGTMSYQHGGSTSWTTARDRSGPATRTFTDAPLTRDCNYDR